MRLAAEDRGPVLTIGDVWRRNRPLIVTLAFCVFLWFAARLRVGAETLLAAAGAYTLASSGLLYFGSIRPGRRRFAALLSIALPVLASCRLLGLVGAWAWFSAVLFGALELVLLVQAFREVRALLRSSEGRRRTVHETLITVVEKRVGRSGFARLIAYELSMYVYAFTRAKRLECPQDTVFRDRGEATWRQMVWALLILFVLEGVVVHLLLSQWSAVAAWALAALQIYGAIWLFADVEALRRYAPSITPQRLDLRLGLRVQSAIDWTNVESVEEIDKPSDDALRCYLNGDPNVLLVLRQPQLVSIALGMERSYRRILLALEEPGRFITAVKQAQDACSQQNRAVEREWTTGDRPVVLAEGL